ncbi:MAG: PAS domain S-box protein, partial [Gallionella sp.]|nr:PAS domain S-box protein [Gallionella sp.]
GGNITMNATAIKLLNFRPGEDLQQQIAAYASVCELSETDGRVLPLDEWPLRRAVLGDYVRNHQAQHRNLKSGDQWICEFTTAPVRNSSGDIIYNLMTFFDITERKQAELEILKLNSELEARVAERTAQLNASSTRIQTILDTIADGIITINQSGIVETMNPAAERLFGYTAAEVIGHNVKMLMPEPYRHQHDSYLEHYCSTGEARVIGIGREVTGRRKDGSTFAMYLAVNEMLLDGQRYFTGIVHDITERKQMVETLQKSSERLRLALDAANQAWFDLDVQTGAVHVSPEYVRLIGFDYESFQPTMQNWFDNMHPDDREAVRATYQACLNSGEPGAMEYRRRNKSGAWQWMYSVGRVVEWDDAHKPVRMIGIHMDISERKLAEQALHAAKEQAELANRAKDSFLATMSHEIRTPLTGMLGMLEVLSLTPLDHDQSETLKTVWDSSRSLLRIVNDILDWSKIEEGKLELSPHSTSIPSMLQEIVNTYSRVASSKSLFLSQHADARLSQAHIVDALRLSQVLNNFVSNALKFTRHGEIELRAELLEQLDSGERVRFSVKDTGIGIAPEVQQHLFQRYMQESADTARMYGGTGLGLSICRRLVELLDGQLELVSTPGQGSTFSVTFVLPVSAAPGETIATVAPDVAPRKIEPLFEPGADAPLVLAVDDHPTNRDLLARQIRLLGLRAETAENGKVALSLWREGRFALVITDCHMPEMDGYAFAREIR